MKLLIVPLVLLLLSGCAYIAEQTNPIDESQTIRISPEYVAAGDTDGLRAFAYGNHTVISSDESFNAWDSNKVALTFEKIGNYFRSEYLLNDFFVQRGFKLAHIKRIIEPEIVELSTVIKAEPEPEPVVKTYPELEAYSLSQLDTLQRELDRQSNIKSTTGADLFYAQVNQNKLRHSLSNHSPVVIVYFDFAKTLFKLDAELRNVLLPAARTASHIQLKGRTDSVRASKADIWIAKQRAVNMKNYLVKNGVDADIIHVEHLPEGDFLLPPRPQVSKAVNRRVEIVVTP